MRLKKAVIWILTGLLLAVAAVYPLSYFAMGLFDRSAPAAPAMSAGGGAVYGYVTAARKRVLPGVPALPGARVSLAPGNYETISDRRGVYRLSGIPAGMYTLTFSAPGYEEYIVEKVRVMPGQALLQDGSLFPIPGGPARAVLRLTTSMGLGKPKAGIPYNTTVYLDAGKSKNASREGFRFEITDERGQILNLTPKITEMPKASPFIFTFQPPKPGEYTVRMLLKNNLFPEASAAEVKVTAVNSPPQAMPAVYPGPHQPQREGSRGLRVSSGLNVVEEGSLVYLRSFALDANYPTPEHYNPGGAYADIYGKNHDYLQRAFGWQWQLELVQGSKVQDVTGWLNNISGSEGNQGQHLYFKASAPGIYRAYLVASDGEGLLGEAGSLEIRVLEKPAYVDETLCLGCHGNGGKKALPVSWDKTAHGKHGRARCQDCHGPGKAHLEAKSGKDKKETIDISRDAGVCGQCHLQYNEWEKSLHSDNQAFGHGEIARPLLLNCTKCHFAGGFAAATRLLTEKTTFKETAFKKRLFPGGPVFFDFSRLPKPNAPGVTCAACHDPHTVAGEGNRTGLRLGSAEALCGSCHQEKWHNVIVRGNAGKTGSAYEYPGKNYSYSNPHDTEGKCVECHMNTEDAGRDENGVRTTGGHTLRMRADKRGLAGSTPENGRVNTASCKKCHKSGFDGRQLQEEIYELWTELGKLIKERNSGILPGFKPGDKCATCHRGGTMPFDSDPELVLEKAYTNYKLIGNDRSFGIHNPGYIRQLLRDSIESLQ